MSIGGPPGKPVFSPDSGFYATLRARVDAYFEGADVSRQAGASMVAKTVVLLLWFAASYALLVFWADTWWQAALLCVSLACAMAGVAFSVQHDANHGAYSKRRAVNHLLGLVLDLLGGSSYVWRWKHNRAHHPYTNLEGFDSDISVPWGRLSPAQPHRRLHRGQHYYLWVMYAFFVAHWQLFQDFAQLATGRIGRRSFPRPRGWRLAEMIAGKAVFFTWAFVLPMLFHPWWVVLLCYAITSAVLSFILVLVFQLAHSVEDAAHPAALAGPDSAAVANSWAVHQVETTANFAQGNHLLSWYVGGLNFQIEHHLFPLVCHVHYPEIAAIVRATCRESGVRYGTPKRLFPALASHWRWLRRMARDPAVPEEPEVPEVPGEPRDSADAIETMARSLIEHGVVAKK